MQSGAARADLRVGVEGLDDLLSPRLDLARGGVPHVVQVDGDKARFWREDEPDTPPCIYHV